MKINFSITKLLDNDKIVKVISVIVAIVAWFVVVIAIDTNSMFEVKNIPVNFDLTGTAPEAYGLSLIEGDGQTINVKVEGKKYIIGNLTPESFVATPILTTVTKPGEYRLNVEIRKVNLRDADYEITQDTVTATITATFDFVTEETFPITAVADNVRAEDGFVKETVLASPDKITVKGAQTEIDRISTVVVENDIDKVVDDTLILDGKLSFYDANGNKLQLKNVTYQEQPYEINVQIYKYVTVPAEVTFVNVPNGLPLDRLSYVLSETNLLIAGPKDIVDNVAFVNLGEIDFRKINIGSTFEMDVSLPAGVVNVNEVNRITVTIESGLLDKKQLSINNFSVKNEPSGYTVKIDTKTINDVKIVGDQDDLKNLTANDLIAVVDLQGVDLSSGKARVQVQIYCSGNKFVWAIGEYNVMVSARVK